MLAEMKMQSQMYSYIVRNEEVNVCGYRFNDEFVNFFNRAMNGITIPPHTQFLIRSIIEQHKSFLEKHILMISFSKENLLFQIRKRGGIMHDNIIRRYRQYRSTVIASHDEYLLNRILLCNQINVVLTTEKCNQINMTKFYNEHNKTKAIAHMLNERLNGSTII
jgi:hypothetical protein